MWNKVVIIGVGLIGGSLALSLKKTGHAKHIVGVSRKQKTLDKALALNIIDEGTTDISIACKNADIIMLAVPVLSTKSILTQIYPSLEPHTLLTDGGSTKKNVVDSARTALKEKVGQFIPAHPIAGTEHSGPSAAFESLYTDKSVILTPLTENRPEDIETIQYLWSSTGANVSTLQPIQHDRIFAATSHLPHLLAFALVNTLYLEDIDGDIFENAATGFESFTRIASSDATMWRDITIANRDELQSILTAYIEQLTQLNQYISSNDADKILSQFAQAKQIRDNKIISTKTTG